MTPNERKLAWLFAAGLVAVGLIEIASCARDATEPAKAGLTIAVIVVGCSRGWRRER